jgi:polyhydroxyalkanoate synthesis regulator phasin
MDIEVIAGLAVLGIGVAVWGVKKYQSLMADGKITLDEIIDTVDDVADKAKETKKEADMLLADVE